MQHPCSVLCLPEPEGSQCFLIERLLIMQPFWLDNLREYYRVFPFFLGEVFFHKSGRFNMFKEVFFEKNMEHLTVHNYHMSVFFKKNLFLPDKARVGFELVNSYAQMTLRNHSTRYTGGSPVSCSLLMGWLVSTRHLRTCNDLQPVGFVSLRMKTPTEKERKKRRILLLLWKSFHEKRQGETRRG